MPLKKAKSTIAALAALAATVVAPIVWDWYAQRVALELQLLAQSVLVERTGDMDKLNVTYDGITVPGLSRVEVALVNTGRKPIRSTDVLSPVTITIDSGQVLDVRAEQLLPTDLELGFRVDSSRHSVVLTAPLLNPGDAARFTLLVALTRPPEVSASARIAGLRTLRLTDRRPESRPFWRALSWPVYLASVGTSVAFVALALFLYGIGYTRRERHYWRARSYHLPRPPSPEQYRSVISLILGPDAVEQKEVRRILESAIPNRPLTEDQKDGITRAIEHDLRQARVVGHWTAVLLFIFFVVGLGYMVYSLIRVARGGA